MFCPLGSFDVVVDEFVALMQLVFVLRITEYRACYDHRIETACLTRSSDRDIVFCEKHA